jgi:hypothetical protein
VLFVCTVYSVLYREIALRTWRVARLYSVLYSEIAQRTWHVARLYSVLYSEISVSRKSFEIGHMYIYTFLLRMTGTMTSQNVDFSSWDTV